MDSCRKVDITEVKKQVQNHDDGGFQHGKSPRHTPVAQDHKSTIESVAAATRPDDGPELK